LKAGETIIFLSVFCDDDNVPDGQFRYSPEQKKYSLEEAGIRITIHVLPLNRGGREFEYHGLNGTPYCVIYKNDILNKRRIYLLDTRDKLYYPLAEWDEDDSETWNRWPLCGVMG
jgi:hypothetical protein